MLRRLVPADQFPRTGQDLHAGRARLQDLGQRRFSGQRIGQRVPRLQAALQGHVAARRIAEQAPLSLLGQGHRQIHRDRRRAHASLAAKNHDPPRPGCHGRVRRRNLADEGSKFGGLIHGRKRTSNCTDDEISNLIIPWVGQFVQPIIQVRLYPIFLPFPKSTCATRIESATSMSSGTFWPLVR